MKITLELVNRIRLSNVELRLLSQVLNAVDNKKLCLVEKEFLVILKKRVSGRLRIITMRDAGLLKKKQKKVGDC